MATAIDGIFSIRLVIADFYLQKPILGLDSCYSEFRGREVKRVPVIRIFGSTPNAQGRKTCMHIHGVFPYFYIPYEKKDFDSVQKAVYLIATNLDKAINISLGQGSSSAQHVFKVQLVKGIPFYGYHRNEHQYLKIYMYNPRFVRRAANLLQNGIIMNKVFNACESHVPYILQFMIDYNLYGMSLLHVPFEVVKFRRIHEDDPIYCPNVQPGQMLCPTLVTKLSTCAVELDINSNFILNRFQLLYNQGKKNSNVNPGIEAIWHDERTRRNNIMAGNEECEVPPLEVAASQDRPDGMKPTESDIFYRSALLSKLIAMEESGNMTQLDTTIGCTHNSTLTNITDVLNVAVDAKEQKRKFNLSKLLVNAVYPEECTQNDEDHLINASCIADHFSGGSAGTPLSIKDSEAMDDTLLNDTIIDEELVLSLTQSQPKLNTISLDATLREEDMELLDVLQQLEEDNADQDQLVDMDSTLAPLSQPNEIVASGGELAANGNELSTNEEADDSTANVDEQDFTMALDDIDELLLELTQTFEHNDKIINTVQNTEIVGGEIPQMDGADDGLHSTPRRGITRNLPNTPQSSGRSTRQSVTTSPRTPKTNPALKYAPLPNYLSTRTKITSNEKLPDNSNHQIDQQRMQNVRVMLGKRLALHRQSIDEACTSDNLPNDDHDDGQTTHKKTQKEVNNKKTTKISTRKAKAITTDSGGDGATNKRRVTRSSTVNGFDNDKTRITCSLTPRRSSKRLLKVYHIDNKKSEEAATFESVSHATGHTVLNTFSKENTEKITNHKDDTNNLITSIEIAKNIMNKKNCEDDDAIMPSDDDSDAKLLENCNESSSVMHSMRKSRRSKEISLLIQQLRNVAALAGAKKMEEGTELCSAQNEKPIQRNESPENELPVEHSQSTKITENRNDMYLDAESIQKCESHQIHSIERSQSIEIPKSCSIERPQSIVATEISNPMCIDDEPIQISESEESDLPVQPFQTIKSSENCFHTEISNPMCIDDEPIQITESQVIETPADCSQNRKHMRIVEEEGDDGIIVQSFYDQSFTFSPSIFSDTGSGLPFSLSGTPPKDLRKPLESSSDDVPTTSAAAAAKRHGKISNPNNDVITILTPLDLPPTYEMAIEGCRKLNIPENNFQHPFYSNPDDVMQKREVGHIILQIRSNKLNDCAPFESVLKGTLTDCEGGGLTDWRCQLLHAIGEPLAHGRILDMNIRDQCVQMVDPLRKVIIEPHIEPPTRHDAKVWLKAHEILVAKTDREEMRVALEEDSPIKVRRQKISMILHSEGGGGGDGDQDGDCNLTLTPMTPLTPNDSEKWPKRKKDVINDTPKTSSMSLTPTEGTSSRRIHRRRSLRSARLSLSTRLLKASATAAVTGTPINLEESNEVSEEIQKSPSQSSLLSQSTDEDCSVTSEQALVELQRSSFRQQFNGRPASATGSPGDDLSFGLSNATLDNTYGFKVKLENLQKAKADIEYTHLTIITLEVFVPTRGDLFPNPEFDAIVCLFYAIEHSEPPRSATKTPENTPSAGQGNEDSLPTKACGCIIVQDEGTSMETPKRRYGLDANIEIVTVRTEMDAFECLLQLCRRWDADIYAGYEIETGSWGYVIERAKYLCLNIAPLLSRVPTQKMRDFVDEDERDSYTDLDFEMKLCGRILLDVWRLMRSEIALTSYTFENVVYHILHRRCPRHNYRALTEWWQMTSTRWIVMEYYLERVRGTLALLDQLDLLGRTSEMAKLIGIQFYEVFSRGSQFRVESMMLRMAKPRNLVPLSPSVKQRAHMRAPEYLPLILEPHSRFYADPMVVLDFQSLYPSMIIAYNYCFSTCLGRAEHLGQTSPFEFAASQLRVSPAMLRKLLDRDLVTCSPCGVVFVKRSVREGILPRMLSEILDTRLMVKQSMKIHARRNGGGDALQRILHSRQLGLKLMANVTYGYTAANFSGRMPAVEVGDSVVAKGRETLERAIKLVEANESWRAKVVYGDTDSMFVLLVGRTREEAFVIGEEIAEAVSKTNPPPVKLKLEKVYQPCVLQTKKRYVGNMYESAEQSSPVFEAKGIETVRRDGCPAASKMLEKVLRLLFETADVSIVKRYVCRQFTKLLSGRANLQDLIFAKEFRGLGGYKPTACVPALEMTRKWMQTDPRRVPRSGERVPYVIVNGPPGVPLIRLVRSPHELLNDPGLHINVLYYITKAIIPPLNRCLFLIGADAHDWFASLPRKMFLNTALGVGQQTFDDLSATTSSLSTTMLAPKKLNNIAAKKSTISQYFTTSDCLLDCGRQTKQGVCDLCRQNATKCVIMLQEKASKLERHHVLTQQVCVACCGRDGGMGDSLRCTSLDCPVLFVGVLKRQKLQQLPIIRQLIKEF